MRKTLLFLFSLLLNGGSLLLIGGAPAAAKDTLTIYTYESFTADWGPGPQIKQAFEAKCDCTVDFVAVADGVALLNRVRLEGADTHADIVLGLDTNLTAAAEATGLFAPHGLELSNVRLPGGWADPAFVPFDYGHFAVIYDSEVVKDPPTSLRELMEGGPEPKIVIQDPRTSTPGLGLVFWVRAIYGDDAQAAWEKFSDRVLTVTPGWSEAYGLFTAGEAPMVLSYITSPAYHMVVEGTDRYKAAPFEEGHYMQIEVAGMTQKGSENPLAAEFLEFMTGPKFQNVIPTTNWMMPAGMTSKPLPDAFNKLIRPAQSLILTPDMVEEHRKAWVDEWLAAMSR